MLATLEQATELINQGKYLHIAGCEELLAKLPKGKWIGGTTAYFISESGGMQTKEYLSVHELSFAEEVRIADYGKYNIFQIVEECYDHGFTTLILPFASEVAAKYAKEAPDVDELFLHPTAGWVAGYDYETVAPAKVFNGETGKSFGDRAVVMYSKLPENKNVKINIINIFEEDKESPVITFPENTMQVGKCFINGKEENFAEYIRRNRFNIQIPLISEYNGVYINTAVKAIGIFKVELCAPVFKGVEYRFAAPVANYEEVFRKKIEEARVGTPALSCNCILNYMYGNLQGVKTPPFTGPVTFGEVAYQLMNQTLVYCEIV